MSTKRRGHGTDKRGRRKTGDRFVKLEHYMLSSSAWLSLHPAPRALYLQLAFHYNGLNNGEISMSVRQAARLIHVAKDTALKAFWELDEKGFIHRNQCGSFDWKARHATTWILTAYPFNDNLATKDFMRWVPKKTKAGPNQGPNGPNMRTVEADSGENDSFYVLDSGPCARCSMGRRSRSRVHIYYTKGAAAGDGVNGSAYLRATIVPYPDFPHIEEIIRANDLWADSYVPHWFE